MYADCKALAVLAIQPPTVSGLVMLGALHYISTPTAHALHFDSNLTCIVEGATTALNKNGPGGTEEPQSTIAKLFLAPQ
jgi:hypothetical protein